jgi:hypothetical protein
MLISDSSPALSTPDEMADAAAAAPRQSCVVPSDVVARHDF